MQSFHILANIWCCHFSILDILVSMKSYLLLISICILSIANYIELLIAHLQIFFCELCKSSIILKIDLPYLWLICRHNSYILKLFYNYIYCYNFPSTRDLSFHFSNDIFFMGNFVFVFNFEEVQIINISFYVSFACSFNKYFTNPRL